MWVYHGTELQAFAVDPHLAKNERDVGHPNFALGKGINDHLTETQHYTIGEVLPLFIFHCG
jgi:hypothetical protein